MPRSNHQQPLKTAIRDLLRAYNLEDQVYDAKVVLFWRNMMGSTLARYTQDIYVRQGTLHITVTSAPLKNELLYAKAAIIERINTELGKQHINELIIR